MSEQRFALLIANSVYKDTNFRPLPSSANDVERLGRVLKDPNIGGFASIKTIINKPENTVRKAISQFFEDKKQSDLLVVYFSGHGVLDSDGTLYFPLKDTEKRYLSATGLEAEFITREMDKKRLGRVVLILDSCYSGAFDRPVKSTAIPDLGVTFNSGYGRIVITASSATEEAAAGGLDKEMGEYSLFTGYLIEGLETGKAGGASEWISIDDLYTYASAQVMRTPKPQSQTPMMVSKREGSPLIIAKNLSYRQQEPQSIDVLPSITRQVPENPKVVKTIVSNQKVLEGWTELQNNLEDITSMIDQFTYLGRGGQDSLQEGKFIWDMVRIRIEELADLHHHLQDIGPAHRADGSIIQEPEWDPRIDEIRHLIDQCYISEAWEEANRRVTDFHHVCERYKLSIRLMISEVIRESTSITDKLYQGTDQ